MLIDMTATPSEQVDAATTAIVTAGRAILDPIERAFAYEHAIEKIRRDLTNAVAAARAEAVTEARQTRTIAQLAEQLGVTPARVYQIMKGGS